ncbi:MAG: putative OB-fold protein [Acidimicrobiales bacterium]|jgi:uncharacterized protein
MTTDDNHATVAGTLPSPSPEANLETQPFWDAAAEGRFVLPVCDSCSEAIWYPRVFCPHCGGSDVTWTDSAGTGTIYSFTVVERGQGRWREHSPYVLAYIELDEGPRMMSNIIEANPDDLAIGQPVSVRFDPGADGGNLVRFGPAV